MVVIDIGFDDIPICLIIRVVFILIIRPQRRVIVVKTHLNCCPLSKFNDVNKFEKIKLNK